jgi:hypothetical protein
MDFCLTLNPPPSDTKITTSLRMLGASAIKVLSLVYNITLDYKILCYTESAK